MVLYLLIYVDIIFTSNIKTLVADYVTKLSEEFSLRNLGNLSYFLGIKV